MATEKKAKPNILAMPSNHLDSWDAFLIHDIIDAMSNIFIAPRGNSQSFKFGPFSFSIRNKSIKMGLTSKQLFGYLKPKFAYRR